MEYTLEQRRAHFIRQTCTRKTPYTTKRAAKDAIKDLRRAKGIGRRLHVYRCPVCKYYHYGHRQKGRPC